MYLRPFFYIVFFSLLSTLFSCDDEPIIPPSVDDQSFSVPENSTSGTVIGSIEARSQNAEESLIFVIISGNTNDAFRIDNTGIITVNNESEIDFEVTSQFILDIDVNSSLDQNVKSTIKITINVENLPDIPPLVDNQLFSVFENSSQGTLIGNIDAVSQNEGETLLFEIISGNINNACAIDNNGTLLINEKSVFDFEMNPQLILEIEVKSSLDQNTKSIVEATVNIKDAIAPIQDGLIAYFPFNGNVIDESGYDNYSLSNGNPVFVDDRNGTSSSAIMMDGADDYIDLGTSSIYDISLLTNFSFSYWISPDQSAFTGERVVISKYNSATDTRLYKMGVRPEEEVVLRLYDRGTVTSEFIKQPIIYDWMHVVVVFDGNEVSMYVNGELKSSFDYSVTLKQLLSNIPTYIGAAYFSNTSPDLLYKGLVDDVAFYEKSLTPDEVETLYTVVEN